MKKKTAYQALFTGASFFVTLALTAGEIAVFLGYYDFEASLWRHGVSPLVKGLMYILIGLVALFAMAFSLTVKGEEGESGSAVASHAATLPTRVASLLVAILLASTLVAQLIAIGSFDHLNLIFSKSSADYVAIAAAMHAVCLILALPACLWFVAIARGKKPSVGFGLLSIAYFIALVLRVYFDMTDLLSDPRHSLRVVTIIAAAIYLLLEVRLAIAAKRLALYRTVAVTAMAVTAASGITNLTLNLTGHFHDGIECVYFALELVLAAYIAARLFSVKKQTAVPQASTEALTDTANTISAETVEAEIATKEAVEPQKSDATEAANPIEEARSEEECTPIEDALPEETSFAETDVSAEESVSTEEDKPAETVAPAEETTPAAESAPDEKDAPEADDLPDLTEDEVKRFYKAVMTSVAKRHGLTADADDSEKQAVKEECHAIIEAVLSSDDRNARIAAVRAYLAKAKI